MYGYIYKTTNKINNMIYIGQKKSDTFLYDKYLGSGKRLQEAIKKYGKESFSVELLEEVENENLMDEKEIYWINFYNSTDKTIGYNLSEGGNVNRTLKGEHNGFFGKHHSEETKAKWKVSRHPLCGEDHPRYGKHLTDAQKKAISDKNKGRIKTEAEIMKHKETWNSHEHIVSEETRMKLSQAKKGKPGKSKGTIHITNDLEDKMIRVDELEYYISKGWRKGRKKFSLEARSNISKGHIGHEASNKGKIWINNQKINKIIDKQDLDKWVEDGWTKGMVK